MWFPFLICLILAIIFTCATLFPIRQRRSKQAEVGYIEKFNSQLTLNPQTKREMFELYYHGINDIYDSEGNKHVGIEPNPQMAIQTLQELIREEQRPEDKLQLARIMSEGFHTFQPNTEEARTLYVELLNDGNLTDLYLRTQAEEGLRQLRFVNGRLINHFEDNNVDPINENETFAEFDLDIQRAIRNSLDPNFNVRDTRHHNDQQNVHNSGVVGTIKNSVNKLSKLTVTKDANNDVYTSIYKLIDEKLQGAKKSDAKRTLQEIQQKRRSDKLNTGKTIGQTLSMVFERIHSPENREHHDNLKTNLVNNLAEMQEHGKTVCSTGIGNKLVDTLNFIDPNVQIKPTYALSEEIMGKAAKLREEYMNTLSRDDTQSFSMGNHPNQHTLESDMKDHIKNGLKMDYVDTKILTKARLNSEIKKWIEHI